MAAWTPEQVANYCRARRAENMMQQQIGQVVEKVLQSALAGNPQSQRLVIERLLPVFKQNGAKQPLSYVTEYTPEPPRLPARPEPEPADSETESPFGVEYAALNKAMLAEPSPERRREYMRAMSNLLRERHSMAATAG